MTDDKKRKGPAFEKPKEPEAVPSKTAQRPVEMKPTVPLRSLTAKADEGSPGKDRERQRAADPVVTSREKPRVADAKNSMSSFGR